MAKRRFTDDTDGNRNPRRVGTSDERYTYSDMRFVRIELNEVEKAEFKSLMAADEFSTKFLDRCLDAGYNVTIGRDKRGNGILCCIRAELKDMLDGGLILSGRGKDATTAIYVCEYKATYLADEAGWLAAETRRGGSYSDIG